VYPGNSLMNVIKVMTFHRKESFALRAMYADEEHLVGMPKELGTYKIELPPQSEARRVKVRAVLTLHGTFAIQGAQLLEEEVGASETPACNKEEGDADAQGQRREGSGKRAAGDADAPKHKEGDEAAKKQEAPANSDGNKKKRIRRTELVITPSGCPGFTKSELDKRKKQEEVMIAEHLEIEETNARRNDLEAYILDLRGGLGSNGKYCPYVVETQRESLGQHFEKAEDWLYDHADEAKQVYVDKLFGLKLFGDKIKHRFREDQRRPELVKSLEETAASLKAMAVKPAAKQANADASKLRDLIRGCGEAERWLKDLKPKQAQLTKTDMPVLECSAIQERLKDLQRLADVALDREVVGPGGSPDVNATDGDKTGAMDVD